VQPILIAGEVNVETTLAVESFPLTYQPVHFPFFKMASTVSGVGVNQGTAYKALGRTTRLLGLIGQDLRGDMILSGLRAYGLDTHHLQRDLAESTQSLVLYDTSGRRMIFNDLKDIQEKTYPVTRFLEAANGCAAAVICNINFARPLLSVAKTHAIPIVTDVHVLQDPDDAYNRDFMAASDVLFVSNEAFRANEQSFAQELIARYTFQCLIIGMGAEGALLYDRAANHWHRSPARALRPVVNTVGAGDALSACFTDGWLRGIPPAQALDRACYFASWKVGARGAAEGFLSAAELAAFDREHAKPDATPTQI
jgi:acarbose 7IV-phosphotransferase